MSSQVTQLPPTISVKDQDTRQFLDALVNMLDLRSGNSDKNSGERFITVNDLQGAVSSRNGLGIGGPGTSGSLSNANQASGSNSIAEIIDALQNSIKQSLLYQFLQTPAELIDLAPIQGRIDLSLQAAQTGITQVNTSLTNTTLSLTNQIDAAVSRIGATEAGLISEASTRATADTAQTNQLDLAVSRLALAEAAITTESSTRVNRDNALASAIKTIWAEIGSDAALIQDEAFAAVSPAAVQASKWLQVQAAVTDPNTGAVNSTSIKQDLNSYANKVDGSLSSIYSVRATVTNDGKTLVGGFGLSVTNGAGSAAGPTFDFGVRADTFWVGALDGTKKIPFIVRTSGLARPDGTTTPAGVYIDTAMVDSLYGTYINAGLLEAGKIYTGSQYVDKVSRQEIPVVASGNYLNANYDPGAEPGYQTITTQTYTAGDYEYSSTTSTFDNTKLLKSISANLRFYGPDWHASVGYMQRCRNTLSGRGVNFTVSATATVDHYLSIWYRTCSPSGQSAWICLAAATEPQGDYGSCSLTTSFDAAIGNNNYIEFTVSPTSAYLSPINNYKVQMRDLTISVKAINL